MEYLGNGVWLVYNQPAGNLALTGSNAVEIDAAVERTGIEGELVLAPLALEASREHDFTQQVAHYQFHIA